ncbi:MAG: 4-amino-4-deoxy-L-arabinose transferase [Nocardioidaceae bacterium]
MGAEAAARLVLDHCLASAPTLGRGRLVCVDGPAGSGKTTLADAVVAASRHRVPSARVLHMDDMYQGWSGLGDVASRIRDGIVVPLGAGLPGRYRRWDWLASAWAEEHVVGPVSLLVVEGVGSGALEYADAIGTLVWVSAPAEVRLARGLERDGEAMLGHWEQWMVDEAAHFAAQRTRERADVVLDAADGWRLVEG